MTQGLLLILGAALLLAGCPAACQTAVPEPGLHVVYAVTRMAARSASSTVYLQEARSGVRGAVYEDGEVGDRILTRIAGSDLVGAARATERGVYAIMGPSTASDPAICSDALRRLDVSAGMYRPATLEQLFSVPLCFSEESPYGLWNRAPLLAVSRDGRRFAMTALRIGETDLPVPTVRLLSATGEEEWQIQLEGMSLYVADMCWSPDGKMLAYIVMPQGDVHTLDESLLPKAGVYLADVERRSTRLLYRCFADAVAWGPGADRVTVAARVGDFWSARHVLRVLLCPSGKKVEEFSVRGSVQTLSWSEDGQWLAAQTTSQGGQHIWLYAAAGGWGRLLHDAPDEGRLALLGWTRTPRAETAGEGRS